MPDNQSPEPQPAPVQEVNVEVEAPELPPQEGADETTDEDDDGA